MSIFNSYVSLPEGTLYIKAHFEDNFPDIFAEMVEAC